MQEIANDAQLNAEETKEESKDFDLTSLFDTLSNYIELPPDQPTQKSPPFTVRVIFVYGRSKRELGFKAGKEVKLKSNDYKNI